MGLFDNKYKRKIETLEYRLKIEQNCYSDLSKYVDTLRSNYNQLNTIYNDLINSLEVPEDAVEYKFFGAVSSRTRSGSTYSTIIIKYSEKHNRYYLVINGRDNNKVKSSYAYIDALKEVAKLNNQEIHQVIHKKELDEFGNMKVEDSIKVINHNTKQIIQNIKYINYLNSLVEDDKLSDINIESNENN